MGDEDGYVGTKTATDRSRQKYEMVGMDEEVEIWQYFDGGMGLMRRVTQMKRLIRTKLDSHER